MQESDTRFDNMPIPTFKIPIMFKSVWRCSEIGYTMGCEKGDRRAKNPLPLSV